MTTVSAPYRTEDRIEVVVGQAFAIELLAEIVKPLTIIAAQRGVIAGLFRRPDEPGPT